MPSSAVTTSGPSRPASRALWRPASIAALLTLAACSSAPQTPQPQATLSQAEMCPPPPVLPAPRAASLLPVRWHVEGDGVTARFWVDARGYEALSRNEAEKVRWAREAGYQLDFYRRTRGDAR